jgi:hypothetical protein
MEISKTFFFGRKLRRNLNSMERKPRVVSRKYIQSYLRYIRIQFSDVSI